MLFLHPLRPGADALTDEQGIFLAHANMLPAVSVGRALSAIASQLLDKRKGQGQGEGKGEGEDTVKDGGNDCAVMSAFVTIARKYFELTFPISTSTLVQQADPFYSLLEVGNIELLEEFEAGLQALSTGDPNVDRNSNHGTMLSMLLRKCCNMVIPMVGLYQSHRLAAATAIGAAAAAAAAAELADRFASGDTTADAVDAATTENDVPFSEEVRPLLARLSKQRIEQLIYTLPDFSWRQPNASGTLLPVLNGKYDGKLLNAQVLDFLHSDREKMRYKVPSATMTAGMAPAGMAQRLANNMRWCFPNSSFTVSVKGKTITLTKQRLLYEQIKRIYESHQLEITRVKDMLMNTGVELESENGDGGEANGDVEEPKKKRRRKSRT